MKHRSALIVAPPTADLRVLREVLARNAFDALAPDLVTAGATWLDAWRQAVERADLVIGVCEGPSVSASVAFDLGVASGTCDILLIAPPDCDVPATFTSFFVVRAAVTNEEALSFFFDNLGPHKGRSRRLPRVAPPPPTAHQVEGYRTRAASANGVEFERLVADIFSDAGFEARSEFRVGPRHIDLAVWSDFLAAYLDNPLVIEVKLALTERQLAGTLALVTNFTQAAGVRWALIIYRAGPPREALERHSRQASHVLLLSIDDLLDGLLELSLFDILRTLRNRKVHGVTG